MSIGLRAESALEYLVSIAGFKAIASVASPDIGRRQECKFGQHPPFGKFHVGTGDSVDFHAALSIIKFGLDHLGVNDIVLFVDSLELEGEFAGGFAVAGFEVGGGFGAEFAFFFVELFGFGHEFFYEAGVGGEAFVEL